MAQLLFKAVKRASVQPTHINKGDHIVITGKINDVLGQVTSITTTDGITAISLTTDVGEKTLQVSDVNFIHIIQRADMLNLRNHNDYERDLKDVPKGTHKYTDKDCCPSLSPDDASGKSELPASKISLVMKKKR